MFRQQQQFLWDGNSQSTLGGDVTLRGGHRQPSKGGVSGLQVDREASGTRVMCGVIYQEKVRALFPPLGVTLLRHTLPFHAFPASCCLTLPGTLTDGLSRGHRPHLHPQSWCVPASGDNIPSHMPGFVIPPSPHSLPLYLRALQACTSTAVPHNPHLGTSGRIREGNKGNYKETLIPCT